MISKYFLWYAKWYYLRMLTGNIKYLSEEEYEEYLFLRFYVQNWKVKKLLRQRDKIRNQAESCKTNSDAKLKCESSLEEMKHKIKKEAKELQIRKMQLSNYEAYT